MRSSRCPLVACSDVIGSSVTDILMWQRPPKRSDEGRLLLFCYYRAVARWPAARQHGRNQKNPGNRGKGNGVNVSNGSTKSARKNTASVSAEPTTNSTINSLS